MSLNPHERRPENNVKDAETLLGARRAEKLNGEEETFAPIGEDASNAETPRQETENLDVTSADSTQEEMGKEPIPEQEDQKLYAASEERTLVASKEPTRPEELADVRAKALEDKPRFLKLRATIMALAVPLAIFALSARAIASTAFLWLEYHRPGFPADEYGFSTDDRMLYGSYGVNYILNWAPSSYLSEIRVDAKTKLFLESEVGHMTDVKHIMLAGMILATLVVLLALFSSKSLTYRSPGTIRKSLFIGSLITLVAMVALGVIAVLGWESFFTNFHHLLFPQGNWEFRMSDSLIRLYPPQFWVDAGIAFAVLSLLLVGLMLVLTWPGKNRRARAQLLRAFRDKQKKLLQG